MAILLKVLSKQVPCEMKTVARRAFVSTSVHRVMSDGRQLGDTDFRLLTDDIAFFAAKKQTGVSLKTLTQTGQGDFLHLAPHGADNDAQRMLFQVAMFLHRELPIRLARRVRDLDTAPFLSELDSTQLVRNMYVASFEELRASAVPNTSLREEHFAQLLNNIYERHSAILLMMAQSAYELRGIISKNDFHALQEVHNFLDKFYLSRIGMRMLIGQYLQLREETDENYVGLVCKHTSPANVAQTAIEDSTYMCTRRFGDAPEVTLHGRLDLTFAYVPTHLQYILMELLKNSMRATVEYHGLDNMPPIKVVIADGEENEDVVIKVSDEGGGISRSNMKHIWSYLFTTADPNIQKETIAGNASDFDTGSPLAGLGYGLPISRAYARYFGGDLSIMSMEGYGTDAFVHLSRLGIHDEPLP